jgi:hypothetical protein
MSQCVHFSGGFRGACSVGVEYRTVLDQNHVSVPARYPCRTEMESFTACSNFKPDVKLDELKGLIGKLVKIVDAPAFRGVDNPPDFRLAELITLSEGGKFAYAWYVDTRSVTNVPVSWVTIIV